MMIRARGFSFEMTLDQEATRLRALARHLEDATPTVLTAMGVQAVSWAVQDFRERSQGQAAGGSNWKHISKGGAISRLRGRAPWNKDYDALAKLRAEEEPLKDALRRKLPKGAGNKAARGKIAFDFMQNTKEGKRIGKIKERRIKIKERRDLMIAKEYGNANVGVDTGRLINSLVYGVAPLEAEIKKLPKVITKEYRYRKDPPKVEPLTRAAFDISGNVIRVGSNMKYAGYFDERRPIFGPDFMSSERRQKMDRLIEQAIDKYLEKKFNA